MSDKTSLGDRMKQYEAASRYVLPPRVPAIVRIDGRAFHTYTKQSGLAVSKQGNDPFSEVIRDAMIEAAVALIDDISGAELAYIQSDEISLLVQDDATFTTQPWFGKVLAKVTSVSASIAAAHFNRNIERRVGDSSLKLAYFDARAFVLSWEEVNNYFLWRQNDATKNSISMLAQFHFPHNRLQGMNGSHMQDLLMLEKKINWNDLDVWKKRGYCVRRVPEAGIVIDLEPPIFSKDKEYTCANYHARMRKVTEDKIVGETQ